VALASLAQIILILILILKKEAPTNMVIFDHEKLDVYQEAICFIAWAEQFCQSIQGKPSAKDHLDRASTSIALNIAEGNGKFSVRDRCKFLDIAYGSAVECAACLDVLVAKGLTTREVVREGKESLRKIVNMLIGLRTKIAERVGEEKAEYEYE
jgi:four helix bundle protein